MLETRFTQVIGVEHPVASAGMGGGATSGDLVAAVSEAGGLGVIGASFLAPDDVAQMVRRAREATAKPIGINLLLHATEDRVDEILALEPEVFSTAWARDDQNVAAIFAKAHERGAVCCIWSRGPTTPSVRSPPAPTCSSRRAMKAEDTSARSALS